MTHPIIQDDQIEKLAPSLFTSRQWSGAVDEDVREQFFRVYKPLRDKGMQDYHLSRIATAIYYYRPLLADLLKPTQTKCVVEVGSGRGAKALSWANLFESYVGIELNADDAAQTTALLKDFGVANARVVCGNVDAVMDRPSKYGIERIDLLVLYAVLEHLTIPERQFILRVAEKVYLQGGHVLIAESPNRLCRFDQHSWQLPFTDWLPVEIGVAYAAKSARDYLRCKLDTSSPEARAESLYRIGRGVSFHEFECFWGKETYDRLGVLSDGYSTELLNYYPFLRDEWDLLRFCTDNKVSVRRLFTRYYLEGIFAKHANDGARGARYLPPQEIVYPPLLRRIWDRVANKGQHARVAERRQFWELDEVTVSPGGSLVIHCDETTNAQHAVLLIDVSRSTGRIAVEENRSGARSVVEVAKLAEGRMPIWHTRVALPLGSSAAGVYRVQPEGNGSSLTCQGALVL